MQGVTVQDSIEDWGEAREPRLSPLAVATWTVDAELRVTSWDAGSLLTAPGLSPIALPVMDAFRACGVTRLPLEEHRQALAGDSLEFVLAFSERPSLRVNLSPLRGEEGRVIGAVGVALQAPYGGSADDRLQRDAAFGRALSGFLGYAVRHKFDGSLYQRLVETILAMVPRADAASFWLKDGGGRFQLVSSSGLPLEDVAYPTMPPEALARGERARDGRRFEGPMTTRAKLVEQRVPAPTEPIRETLSAPVVLRGEVVAYLHLYCLEPTKTFDHGDNRLARLFAEELASLFHHAELERSLREERTQLEHLLAKYQALAEFSAEIEIMHDTDELIEHGMRCLLERFEFDVALFTDVEDGVVRFTRLRGAVSNELTKVLETPQPLGAGVNGWVAASGETLYVEDYPSWPSRHQPYVFTGVRSMLALPVLRNGKVRHTLSFATLHRHAAIGDDGAHVAGAFVRRLENAFERAQHLEEIRATREATFRSLGVALEFRDLETRGHTDRVVDLAGRFADRLGLDGRERQALVWGAYLHDLGKVAVPDAILLKPGRLTDEEFGAIRQHTLYGAQMVADIPFLPRGSRQVVRSHHERWDGRGYPDKLAGEDIPLLARMFSLVDVYDALTSERPYKSAWTHAQAVAELARQAGGQFDPDLVPRFIETVEATPWTDGTTSAPGPDSSLN